MYQLKNIEKNGLRIASYNILQGGGDRINNVLNVVKKINPDICGILEAVGWQDKENFRKKFKELGYSFFKLALANSKYNIAVISKTPLHIKSIKRGFRHVVLQVTINNNNFNNLNIYFVHLSPLSEDARVLELNRLIKHTKKINNVIIMGDMNSLSQDDNYNEKILLKKLNARKITKYGTDFLRFDVIKKIKSSGFLDAMIYLNNPPTSSTPTSSNKDPHHASNIRIDYIFLKKNMAKYLKKAEIFKEKITEKASDHYPIYIELSK